MGTPYRRLFIIMLFSIGAFFAHGQPENDFIPDSTLVVGSELDYPPFCFVNDEGEADGFAIELFREAMHHANLDVEFVTGPWDSVKNLLREGEIDALPLVGRTTEREDYFDFTFPYMSMDGIIVVRENNKEILSLNDLEGKEVAVMKGDHAEEFIRSSHINCQIRTTTTSSEALNLLSQGKYDAVIMQKLLALQLIGINNFKNLKTVGPPLKEFPQYLAFAVKQGDRKLLSTLNEGLSMVMTDGTFYRLRSKWFAQAYNLKLKDKRIIVAGDFNYPPYDYLDENGQPDGFNTALTKAIGKKMGVDIQIKLMPWHEAGQLLLERKIDAIQGMYYSANREKRFDLSPAYHQVRHVIVHIHDNFSPQNLADLQGKTVVVQQGDIMHDLVVEHGKDINIITVTSQDDALKLVSEGGADAALVAQVQALYFIEKLGIDNLRFSDNPILISDYCYVVAQGDQDLLSLFTEGIAILKAEGQYHEIYNKYLGAYEEQRYTWSDILLIIVYVAGPLLLIFLLILIWNYTLRRKVNVRTTNLQNEISEHRKTEEELSKKNEEVAAQSEEFQVLNEELMRSNDALEKAITEARESEEKFRNLAETTPTAILLYQDDKWVFCNKAASDITGYSEEELLNMNFWDILHPDYRSAMIGKGVERQQSSIPSSRYEVIIFDKSGKQLWVDLSSASVSFRNKPAGIISAIEITQRKEAQDALRKGYEEIERITSNVPSVIWKARIMEDGTFSDTYISETADEYLGLPKGTINHDMMNFFRYIKPEYRSQIEEEFNKARSHPNYSARVEFEVVKANGESAWFLSMGKVYSGENTQIYGYTVDVTDRVIAEQKLKHLNSNLRKAKRQAEESDNLKTAFLLNISHEVRTPMNAIKGFSDILNAEDLSDEQHKYVSIIQSNADQLLNVIEDVLLVSRLQAEKMPFTEKGVILKEFITELIDSHQDLLKRKVVLVKEIPGELEDLFIKTDIDKLKRLLSELLVNAAKYTSKGTITLKVKEEGNILTFNVEDTGVGIAKEDQEKIFERFYRTEDSQRRAIRGTGLGLSIVKYLVEYLKGDIFLTSMPGQGSNFIVRIPVTIGQKDRFENTNVKSEFSGMENLEVLVIEDEPDNFLLIEALLSDHVKEIVHAADGDKALKWLEKQSFDIALLDIKLPDMNGIDLLPAAKEMHPEMIFIALTAYAMPEDRKKAVEAGCADYLTKPIEKNDLLSAIEKATGKRA